MLIRWPAGKLGDPRDIDTAAQVQDLLPTLCDLTASPLPSSNQFDGRSLARLLRDHQPLEHRKFVVQYSRAKLTKWECCVIDGPWRLVHGNELYHVERDLGQKQNLAADEPDKVAELRQHYEQWWRELESDAATFVRIAIGAPQEPLVELTSADWQDVYCDNANHIREAVGGARGGHWNLNCLQAGKYRVTLRRWPKELDLPFQSSAPAAASGNARAVMGKALPIHAASLRVNDHVVQLPIAPQEKSVTFELDIQQGDFELQAWFHDANQEDLCGAFFVDVSKI